MAHRFNIYATNHVHSRTVCAHLRDGTGFPMVSPAPLLPGGVAMYGFLRGLAPTLEQGRNEGRPWVYVDRGYLRATQGADYRGFFRVTRSAFQHDGRGTFENTRWDRLGMRLAPWRHGRHVLVCPPGDVFLQGPTGQGKARTQQDWLKAVLDVLQANTERPIQIRYKPVDGVPQRSLAEDLQDCHALVTHMSNTAVEAVIAGVPVFCTGRCAGLAMGKSDLTEIEFPTYPDRAGWVAALAANQWTLQELRDGKANHLFESQQ